MNFTFGPFQLDEAGRVLRLANREMALQPRVFSLLVYLVRNRDRVVSKEELFDTLWPNVTVTEASLQKAISVLRATLKEGGMENAIRSFPRIGYRFCAEQRDETSLESHKRRRLRQEIKFCSADDGTRLAYAVVGEGPCLVKAANWLSHLEYEWESPIWAHVFRALSNGRKLIRYDARGNGLSDWNITNFSFEAFVSDLEAVVNASGAERFPLIGISQGCAISIEYAARHPERISHLILYGGFARPLSEQSGNQEQISTIEKFMRVGWGQDNVAFRQFFTTWFIPEASLDQMNYFNELQRRTASPDNAANIFRSVLSFDVDALLPDVQVPTLVLHCREDQVIPIKEGRRLAERIPGAHFVELSGRNHLMPEDDPSWARFVYEINAFLKTGGGASTGAS
jgi:pimeloyl-ACP methyl ester carboxylesterase/DNA-binding winged helix-turn-helix (wHTH) protein